MAASELLTNPSVHSKCYRNEGNPEVLRWVPSDAANVLDLGCGAGDNARLLFGRGISVDGVTLSGTEASVASQVCRSVLVHNLEGGLPAGLAEAYDAVLASHVLEHICFPARLLADVRAKLSPKGVLIVALPNLLHYRYRLRLLRGSFEYAESGIMDNTHFRWYTFASGRRLLETNGFEVVRSYGDGHFPWFIAQPLIPHRLEKFVDKAVCMAAPGLMGLQLLYVARKS